MNKKITIITSSVVAAIIIFVGIFLGINKYGKNEWSLGEAESDTVELSENDVQWFSSIQEYNGIVYTANFGDRIYIYDGMEYVYCYRADRDTCWYKGEPSNNYDIDLMEPISLDADGNSLMKANGWSNSFIYNGILYYSGYEGWYTYNFDNDETNKLFDGSMYSGHGISNNMLYLHEIKPGGERIGYYKIPLNGGELEKIDVLHDGYVEDGYQYYIDKEEFAQENDMSKLFVYSLETGDTIYTKEGVQDAHYYDGYIYIMNSDYTIDKYDPTNDTSEAIYRDTLSNISKNISIDNISSGKILLNDHDSNFWCINESGEIGKINPDGTISYAADDNSLNGSSEQSNMSEKSVDIVKNGVCGDNITWTIDSNGTLVVSGTGEMWNYGENSKYENPWPTDINTKTNAEVKKIVIENGVTSIGDDAFTGFGDLTTIDIANSVHSIGEGAFARCGMTSITIPDSVNEIGARAFFKCYLLESVTLPKPLRRIEEETFMYCNELKEIYIPQKVVNIVTGAFFGASSLSDIYYGGREEDWNAIIIEKQNNDDLFRANIHYNSDDLSTQ